MEMRWNGHVNGKRQFTRRGRVRDGTRFGCWVRGTLCVSGGGGDVAGRDWVGNWLPLDQSSLDRTVKALDVCNGITHGVEAIRHAQKLAEVVVLALEHRSFTVGFDKFGLG
ncbi:hypothetical protein Droror1_Dr00026507 [Drosera rotundifolia]